MIERPQMVQLVALVDRYFDGAETNVRDCIRGKMQSREECYEGPNSTGSIHHLQPEAPLNDLKGECSYRSSTI